MKPSITSAGVLERLDVEDLGADVAVDALEADPLQCRRACRTASIASPGLQREAELAVDLAGAHEVVGVGVDARLDAEQDLRDLAPADGELVEQHAARSELSTTICPPRIRAPRSAPAPSCCCRGKRCCSAGKPTRYGGVELARRTPRPAPCPSSCHNPADRLAAERLAGVGHEPSAAVVAVDRLTVACARCGGSRPRPSHTGGCRTVCASSTVSRPPIVRWPGH